MRWGRPAAVVEEYGFEAEAVGFAGESAVVSVSGRMVLEKVTRCFASSFVKNAP
jgi:hypothetical protein